MMVSLVEGSTCVIDVEYSDYGTFGLTSGTSWIIFSNSVTGQTVIILNSSGY